jgi:hypothetical protein
MFEKVTVGKAFEPVAVDAFMTILGMKTLDELVQIRALLTPCPLTELEFQIRGYPCRELSGHTCGDGVEEM